MDNLKIIFRQYKTKPYEVFALFPELAGTNCFATCTSYQHMGQHGIASIRMGDYSNPCKNPAIYTPLLKELQSIYDDCNLSIVQRFTNADKLKRIQQIKGE